MNGHPFLLRRLRELGLADSRRTQALASDGIVTLADLELAIAEQRVVVSDAALGPAAATLREDSEPLTLGRSWDVLEALSRHLSAGAPQLDVIEVSGDVRRFDPLPQDLIVTARTADPAGAAAALLQLPAPGDVVYRTERRLILHFLGREVDVRIGTPDEFGTLLFITTGPAQHVAEVQRRRGARLCSTEAEVYAHAGVAYLPPEVRHAPGILDEGVSPALVTRDHIRGDLHMHTTYSDGRDSIREMVAGSHALGYEYMAITDHSEHAAASRTLDADALERQRDEIARLREQFPQITILHGIEAEILADGRIDCPEATMESLDIVLASLHERNGDNGRRLTERCLRAIRHPLVSMITHPQNQLVGHRHGYDMDYSALYEAAAEFGTILEIDGAPAHLDMDAAHARDAVQHRVTVAIDSDCHRASWLERQMRFGVGTARRGRVEVHHVLNTRPLNEVRAFLGLKRGR